MSAPRVDEEIAIYNIATVFQSHLNSKLDSINSEKNDGITCAHVDTTNGYAIITLEEKIMNADPILGIFIEDIRTVSLGAASESALDLIVVVIKEDQGEDFQIQKKMLRYMRACREVIEDNYSEILTGGILEIKNLGPRFLQGLNKTAKFRGAGISISVPVSS